MEDQHHHKCKESQSNHKYLSQQQEKHFNLNLELIDPMP
jgi:hypothetical protein